jgi:hypothetical protein
MIVSPHPAFSCRETARDRHGRWGRDAMDAGDAQRARRADDGILVDGEVVSS